MLRWWRSLSPKWGESWLLRRIKASSDYVYSRLPEDELQVEGVSMTRRSRNLPLGLNIFMVRSRMSSFMLVTRRRSMLATQPHKLWVLCVEYSTAAPRARVDLTCYADLLESREDLDAYASRYRLELCQSTSPGQRSWSFTRSRTDGSVSGKVSTGCVVPIRKNRSA